MLDAEVGLSKIPFFTLANSIVSSRAFLLNVLISYAESAAIQAFRYVVPELCEMVLWTWRAGGVLSCSAV